jgi:hypothetical protein
MSRRTDTKLLVLAGIVATGFAGVAFAAEDVAGGVPVDSDLTAVIALQGLPCGKVVDAREQGTDDFLVTCEDGHRYRVYVNGDGRVVVEKRE